jgi:hypothetical protein
MMRSEWKTKSSRLVEAGLDLLPFERHEVSTPVGATYDGLPARRAVPDDRVQRAQLVGLREQVQPGAQRRRADHRAGHGLSWVVGWIRRTTSSNEWAIQVAPAPVRSPTSCTP